MESTKRSRKCANENCTHRTITEHDICSLCRIKTGVVYKKCNKEDCNNKCTKEFCRLHAPKHFKLSPCSWVGCAKFCRKEFCGDHNPEFMKKKNEKAKQKRIEATEALKADPEYIKKRENRLRDLRRARALANCEDASLLI